MCRLASSLILVLAWSSLGIAAPRISVPTVKAAPSQPTAPPAPSPEAALADEPELPSDHRTRVAFFPPVATEADSTAVEKRVASLWSAPTTFQLVSARTIKGALQGQKKECRADDACLAPLARKAKADFFIMGALSVNPDKTVAIWFRLIDAKRRKPIDQSQRLVPYSTPQALAEDTLVDLKQIVRKLDPDQFGRLILNMKERNAEVSIDDRVVGMSPLAPRPMPTGAYVLDVALDNFKPVHVSFDIEPQADTEIDLKLAHSDAFIGDYKKRAWLFRGSAIGSFALGGAAGVACASLVIYANIKNQDTFDRYFAAGTPLTRTQLAEVDRIKSGLRTADALAITAGVVAGAALAAGVVLWLVGDDPGAYDAQPGPKAGVVPTANGLALSGSF